MPSKSDRGKWGDSVVGIVDRFERVERHYRPATINGHENWRYYFAMYPELGMGQWPSAMIQKMNNSGRQLTQYNFILPVIDSLVDLMLKVPIAPKYQALDAAAKQLTDISTHMIYADREQMNWRPVFRRLILHGLIFEGVIKMKVSSEYTPLGNIAFENLPFGCTFFDPFWKTGLRKDLKRVYKKSWMSAKEIYRKYKTDRAKYEMELNETNGEEYGPFVGVNMFDVSNEMLGTLHPVYEEYYMEPVKQSVEIISGPDQDIEMPDIPDDDKPAFMDSFLPGWDKTSVYLDEFTVEECRIRTACPTMALNDLLVDGERIEEQIGSPPFFKWAATYENGQSRGAVDSLKDAQTNQNFLEAEILRKIQSEGGGGGQYVDESLFINKKEAARYRKFSNRPDQKFFVKPGTLRKGLTPAIPVETTGVPQAMYSNISHIQRDIVPNISKRPPVSMGQMDEKDMSGKLFNLMGTQSESQMGSTIMGYRDFMNEVYEAYLLQAGQTYTNEMIPREFVLNDKIQIANEPIELQNGQIDIRNDLRGLRRLRHLIRIDESKSSPSQKAETAKQLLAYMNIVPKESVGSRMVINNLVAKNIEQIPEKEMAELDEMSALEKDVARAELRVKKMTLDMQAAQIAENMQMMAGGGPQGGPMAPQGAGERKERSDVDETVNGYKVDPNEVGEMPLDKAEISTGTENI